QRLRQRRTGGGVNWKKGKKAASVFQRLELFEEGSEALVDGIEGPGLVFPHQHWTAVAFAYANGQRLRLISVAEERQRNHARELALLHAIGLQGVEGLFAKVLARLDARLVRLGRVEVTLATLHPWNIRPDDEEHLGARRVVGWQIAWPMVLKFFVLFL